jgi:hypothetical protein
MWNEIYKNIFYNELAIDENDVDYLINKIKNEESHEVKDDDFETIINKTTFRFHRSKYVIHEDFYAMTIIEKLINLASDFTKLKFDKSSVTRSFQLTTKYFDENSSYGLHFEDPRHFGDYFFVLYLDDCEDGELVFPDKKDIERLFDENREDKNEWNKGVKNLNLGGYSPLIVDKTFKIKPKRNTAILGSIPYAHYVNKTKYKNSRIVVNGFPFSK